MEKIEVRKFNKEDLKKLENKSKGFMGEFKTFILKGNVLDLAVGVIIGSAFSNIVTSLINNIISPIIGCFAVGGFNDFTIKIWHANLGIGAFIMDVVNFVIMAFVVFLIVKFCNNLTKINHKEEKKEEAKSDEVKLLESILTELKKKN